MIPDITFKEFVNNLFDYTKTPLENRNWITATKDNLFTYAYTWAEIEDYINRWLKMVPIDKLDIEVNTAFDIMDKIVDNWYQINFNNPTGRTGYFDEPYIDRLDNEEFELHTKVRELIWRQAQGLREINEPPGFEVYLLCQPEKKEDLMNKIGKYFQQARPQEIYLILRALEEERHIDKNNRKPDNFYNALNRKFDINFKQQNWESNQRAEESIDISKKEKFKNKINDYRKVFS